MTCQECEVKLGTGEDASEHLASCSECRWLAEELRLNSVALHDMRIRPTARWQWGLAAVAAAIVMGVGLWMNAAKKPPVRVVAGNVATVHGENEEPRLKPVLQAKARATRRRALRPVQPLKVKMFTSDPDVVIYWIVDRKEGSE